MKRYRSIALALLALDVAASIVVFNLVTYLRQIPFWGHGIVTPLLAPAFVIVLAIYLIDGYKARTDMLSADYASQHAIALLSAMVVTLIITYVFIPEGYPLQSSRLVIVLSFLTLIPATLIYRRLIHLRVLASREVQSIIFLGSRSSCEEFRAECQEMGITQRVIFSVVDSSSARPLPGGTEADLQPFALMLERLKNRQLSVEAIILRETAGELAPEVSRQLVDLYFAGVPTYTLELFHQIYWRKIPLYRLNQTWLFQEGFQIAREPFFDRLKRISDIVFSIFGLLLGAPVVALAGLAVWLEDRGPVFFTQTRVGKNHAPFRVFKLRTMRTAPGEGNRYTQPGDARITRVGRFLRAARLDELPQLWNVLRGDMSLIGPRAEWDRLVEEYERQIPCYHFRHLVKPGITGWAQVNYHYGASLEDTLRKLEFDCYYIRHFSFMLDAAIILKTIHIMLFGKGR
ncbi:MAG: exopolysaccharide biosynthesis polyprenyl glycosylphosphotransferase [Verrucomicrobia bacterium]|nr:exopolysaccharide biosynthesis polyprenyl glycosylphosphotransferase [Verrucomicrobiota bacterium]